MHLDSIVVCAHGCAQLFHIDFGHFLGNWKSKLGVKRERVKFILTPDFVYALTNGEGQKSEQFRRFKDVCKRAYLIVRRQANLFINLLNMMLCTGIPELTTHEDVYYLRETLCLHMTEEAAAENFMQEVRRPRLLHRRSSAADRHGAARQLERASQLDGPHGSALST